jgi:hypothetical protein
LSHGGKRPGAGRKPGVPSQKTIDRLKIAEQAAEEGVLPLELMLTRMRDLWSRNSDEAHREACEVAQACAPFLHPKLASTEYSGKDGGSISFTWLPPQQDE